MPSSFDLHAGGVETLPPTDFRWPDGKRLGIFFRVALEAWSDDAWPGFGPMGNPLRPGVPDLNALGWVEYGIRRGIHRILDVLDRQQIRTSMLICGALAERHPQTLRSIADAGHEIIAHSWGMDVIPAYLDEDAERANIRRTTEALERACGVRPTGWISPRATPSPRTARLLAEEGYLWHGDTMNDDLPYLVRFGEHEIAAFPGGMEMNDTPHAIRYGNPPRQMLELFDDWLDYVRRHERGAVRLNPSIHGHVFGRITGIGVFEQLIERARALDDGWIGRQGDAIAHLRRTLGRPSR
ncbi:MAG: polysaccharide deacetylase family protein [Burkholderiaceae bacterium]